MVPTRTSRFPIILSTREDHDRFLREFIEQAERDQELDLRLAANLREYYARTGTPVDFLTQMKLNLLEFGDLVVVPREEKSLCFPIYDVFSSKTFFMGARPIQPRRLVAWEVYEDIAVALIPGLNAPPYWWERKEGRNASE